MYCLDVSKEKRNREVLIKKDIKQVKLYEEYSLLNNILEQMDRSCNYPDCSGCKILNELYFKEEKVWYQLLLLYARKK